MIGHMFRAAQALSHWMGQSNIDSDKVTVIICADDPMTRSRIELAIAREFDSLLFAPREQPKCTMSAFKLHGVRVVVSDLAREEPMYLITKDAPR
jgi:hypothetical protein